MFMSYAPAGEYIRRIKFKMPLYGRIVQTTGTASGYDLCPYFFFALFQLRNSITTNGIPR